MPFAGGFRLAALTVTALAQPLPDPSYLYRSLLLLKHQGHFSSCPLCTACTQLCGPPPHTPPRAGSLTDKLCSGGETHSWELLGREQLPTLLCRETRATQSFKKQSLHPKVRVHPNSCPVSKLLTASQCNVLQQRINSPGRGEERTS